MPMFQLNCFGNLGSAKTLREVVSRPPPPSPSHPPSAYCRVKARERVKNEAEQFEMYPKYTDFRLIDSFGNLKGVCSKKNF